MQAVRTTDTGTPTKDGGQETGDKAPSHSNHGRSGLRGRLLPKRVRAGIAIPLAVEMCIHSCIMGRHARHILGTYWAYLPYSRVCQVRPVCAQDAVGRRNNRSNPPFVSDRKNRSHAGFRLNLCVCDFRDDRQNGAKPHESSCYPGRRLGL